MKILNHKLEDEKVDHSYPTSKTSGEFANGLPDTIVIHYTAGRDAISAVRTLTKPSIKASAHLVVGRDLKIYQLAPFNAITWHAGKSNWKTRSRLNNYSIGIEIDNAGRLELVLDGEYISWFKKSYRKQDVVQARHRNETKLSFWHRYTEDQIGVVFEICESLMDAYPIHTIVGHEEISPGRKIDPGPAFPLDKLRERMLYADRKSDELSDDEISDEPAFTEGFVKANQLNIRHKPSLQSGRVTAPLQKGTRVKIIDQKGDWLKVKVEAEGWVSGKWIDVQ